MFNIAIRPLPIHLKTQTAILEATHDGGKSLMLSLLRLGERVPPVPNSGFELNGKMATGVTT